MKGKEGVRVRKARGRGCEGKDSMRGKEGVRGNKGIR